MECESRDKSILPCRYFIKPLLCGLEHNFLCIEAKKRKAMRISHSEITTYGKCYRMWWWSYMAGMEMVHPPVRMLAGRIFGECLAEIVGKGRKWDWRGVLGKYEERYKYEEEIPRELILIRAWMEALDGMAVAEEKGEVEYEFLTKDLDYPQVHGYLDLVRMDEEGNPSYGKEFKYSTNSDWSKFVLNNQLSTYFWGVPSIQRIEVVVFKVPGLRWIQKGKNAETAEGYKERVRLDIVHNKLEYMDKKNYFRNEFDIEALKARYQVMTGEMYNRLQGGIDSFYQTDNREVCFKCQYLKICESGVISEQLYKKKEVRDGKDSAGQGRENDGGKGELG